MAKRKQLQEAKQEAWEREIKMQTQPLKMISLGCVWEGETTAIAAKQLEKLLSFKVANLFIVSCQPCHMIACLQVSDQV